MNRDAPSPRLSHSILACGLMVGSGFAGLAYQIVWTQQSTLWLGHESAAVLAVVAAFFGGLACGALWLSRFIERTLHAARWYAGCEIVIGVWSIALALLFKSISEALLMLIGPQSSALWHGFVAFCGTFLVLLPATAAMGATLPAMERVLAGLEPRSSTIGVLYAANTLGAVLGVLGAAFWLVPEIGLIRTAGVCALLNLGCALVAMRLPAPGSRSDHGAPETADGLVEHQSIEPRSPEHRSAKQGSVEPRSAEHRPSERRASAQRSTAHEMLSAHRSTPKVHRLLATTGLLGIGYEVLVVRALSQVAENTVYTFAILLAVYLIGTTLGAGIYARWFAGRYESSMLRDRLLQSLAIASLLGTLLLSRAEAIKTGLLGSFDPNMPAALTAETLLAAMAFLLPTLLMGALFSHLSTSARATGITFGRAIGINTLGAALAPLLFSVLLVPFLGLKLALLLVAAGHLILISAERWAKPQQWVLVAATMTCVVWAPSLQIVTIPAGARLVTHIDGVMASVSVVEDAAGNATLHIDNRQQEGSTATLFSDARQALLPILLHPAPRRALFLGVGTGLTAASATLDPALQVDAIELVPEVIAVSSHFPAATASTADRSRLHLMSADARRFVRTSAQNYDVIVSDNFHPARSGSGSLYTVEHFALVQSRLTQGGLFCQWLPLHQLDLKTLQSIVRSFLAVYPHGAALLATNSLETPVVGLLARSNGGPFEIEQVRERLTRVPSQTLQNFDISDDLALLGTFIADAPALARFSTDAPLNTDDHPIVAYQAPHVTYAPESLPRDRLISLLRVLTIHPEKILTSRSGSEIAAWNTRLSAYWAARNQFLEAGRNVRATADVRDMLSQVRAPLLSVLHVSPDFRPAYDPLLLMATALSRIDPHEASVLLGELQEAQPSRPEAGQRLREISHP